MLDTAFKEQLRQIFAGLEADYVFDIAVHHSMRAAMN